MASELTYLMKGCCNPANDEKDLQLRIPNDLDLDKFNRGRNFFKRNVGQCLTAMMMSLIVGRSIDRFSKVLVCTGRSSTPATSYKRYTSTINHVLRWHHGNVWDTSSPAFKSICTVRSLHANARKFMYDKGEASKKSELENNHVYLSQYDMSLVQSGFIGIIIMYPEQFGIRCSSEELDDYVYFWRWIGYLLGIDDKYNICVDGYEKAHATCRSIAHEVVIPSLENPPAQFYPMADAFVYGFTPLVYPFTTTRSLIAVVARKARLKCPVSLSFTDTVRMYGMSGFLTALFYFPPLAYLFNRIVEELFQCRKFA